MIGIVDFRSEIHKSDQHFFYPIGIANFRSEKGQFRSKIGQFRSEIGLFRSELKFFFLTFNYEKVPERNIFQLSL